MALLKKMSVESDIQKDVSTSEYLNAAEQEALASQVEKDYESDDPNKVSTKKLEAAVEMCEKTFNLSGGKFVVNGFTDKGTKFQLSLSNEDFDLNIVIKDSIKHGIF